MALVFFITEVLECTKLVPSLNEGCGGGGACWVQKRGASYILPSQTGVDWRTFAAGSWRNNTCKFLCLCVNLSEEQTLPCETAHNSCASAGVEGCLSVLPRLKGISRVLPAVSCLTVFLLLKILDTLFLLQLDSSLIAMKTLVPGPLFCPDNT